MHLMYFTEQPMSAYDEQAGRDFGATALMFSNRHFDPVAGSRLYNEYLEHYRLAEEVGFDGIMLNEHHNAPFCMQAKCNIFASILAATTKRVKIVLLGNPLPLAENPVRLAEAFAEQERGSLAVVGDGPLRAELEGRPRVRLVGRVPHAEAASWIAAADVVEEVHVPGQHVGGDDREVGVLAALLEGLVERRLDGRRDAHHLGGELDGALPGEERAVREAVHDPLVRGALPVAEPVDAGVALASGLTAIIEEDS